MFRGQACERPLGPCFLSLFIRACDARQRLSDVLQERDETRLFRTVPIDKFCPCLWACSYAATGMPTKLAHALLHDFVTRVHCNPMLVILTPFRQ